MPDLYSLSRRDVLRLAGTVAALGGAGACMPEPRSHIRSGESREVKRYATSCFPGGYAEGMIAKCVGNRPLKLDGNPNHPASLGGSSIHQQALLFELYDPQRARAPLRRGRPVAWSDFVGHAQGLSGKGLRFLIEPSTSPTLKVLLDRIAARLPESRVHFQGAVRVPRRYLVDRARVICSFGEDLLGPIPSGIRYTRQFAEGRRLLDGANRMNRLYVVETDVSVTGMKADHRLPRKPSEISDAALGLLALLEPTHGLPVRDQDRRWLTAVAADLKVHPGEVLVVAGADQPTAVHAAVHAINVALGALGRTLDHAQPLLQGGTRDELIADIEAGAVQTLIVVGDNPTLAEGLPRAPQLIVAGLYESAADWFVPLSQQLERWEDGRALDGTLSFCQPLIRPLHDTRSALEVLALFAGETHPDAHDLVRATHAETWQRGLRDGFVASEAPQGVWPTEPIDFQPARAALELNAIPDRKLLDGRFSRNLWLQELADPVTKVTWDSVARLGPATAATLGIAEGQYVRLTFGTHKAELPALILPGHAEGAITAELRTSSRRVEAEAIPRSTTLALTQTHASMEEHPIALTRVLAEVDLAAPLGKPATMLPIFAYPATEQWGLAIDLTACTGCSACVVACQVENNIPMVGKDGVLKGRDMHWIRIDRYVSGDSFIVQPMLCQHCEKAPCEYVCPVNATTHSPDGLNEQTYNRCVGTRFCQNNCPYKVRRFNWFDYNVDKAPELRLMMNPEVTVRARGVIEKCTYCVQRIRQGQIEAEKERRPLRDGEIRTACQDACPAHAIAFGNIADKASEVSRWMRQPRTYRVLEELGTQPRTRYLARVTNPNPELA